MSEGNSLLIAGGTVVDPVTKRDGRFDILVEGGLIAEVQPSLRARDGLRVIDASGKLVLPGFLDLHVHLRQPGREDKETIETGARAAARGGFVAVCAMPNTTPAVDHGGAVEWVIQEAKRVGLVEVHPIGALTKGRLGQELTDFGELFEAGCVALSDDGSPLMNPVLMRRALEYMALSPGTRMTDIPVDKVFIGSCTNGRIEDMRAAAAVAKGKKVAANVKLAMVVPGSGLVKAQAEQEGLDKIFVEAGFEWRDPGCSMCLAMNDDRLEPGERCASTSNRNFEGRQGQGGRTHLVSPEMAAAAAIAGHFVDVSKL